MHVQGQRRGAAKLRRRAIRRAVEREGFEGHGDAPAQALGMRSISPAAGDTFRSLAGRACAAARCRPGRAGRRHRHYPAKANRQPVTRRPPGCTDYPIHPGWPVDGAVFRLHALPGRVPDHPGAPGRRAAAAAGSTAPEGALHAGVGGPDARHAAAAGPVRRPVRAGLRRRHGAAGRAGAAAARAWRELCLHRAAGRRTCRTRRPCRSRHARLHGDAFRNPLRAGPAGAPGTPCSPIRRTTTPCCAI